MQYQKIKSIKTVKKATTVYNFHVPNYESYIANGIVTHNCYLNRNGKMATPVTHYMNIEELSDSIDEMQRKLGRKKVPNQQHNNLYVFDIGCSSDCSLDAYTTDAPIYLIKQFAEFPNALASFATKSINEEAWLSVNPKGKTRIRYSIMPQYISSKVDIRTAPIKSRLESANRLVEAEYECHFNLSPVIIYEQGRWIKDWIELFRQMNDILSPKVKAQAACEVIFLTYSKHSHQLNMQWSPKTEEYLWQPNIQQTKKDKPDVICYEYSYRAKAMQLFKTILTRECPWLRIRYCI